MTVHSMKLNPSAFEKIKRGEKTIELRLYDEKRRAITLGDTIEFSLNDHPEQIFSVRVIGLLVYENFQQIYQDLDPVALGSPVGARDDWGRMYNFYSPEDEKKWGIVGIRVQV